MPRKGWFCEAFRGGMPPLSLQNMISVFSVRFSVSSVSRMSPTASSMAESIPAIAFRFLSLIFGKRFRYLSVASIGVCTALKAR